MCQSAYKPGSVLIPENRHGDGHSSGAFIADGLTATYPDSLAGKPASRRVGALSLFGFAPGGVYHAACRCRKRGGLLPHPFSLTQPACGYAATRLGGILSVALSLGLPPPGVTRHRVSLEPGLSSHPSFRT